MKTKYVLCINDKDCDDLEKGRVYVVLTDTKAKKEGYIRVVDDSGEDYLYPDTYFVSVVLPIKARQAFATTG